MSLFSAIILGMLVGGVVGFIIQRDFDLMVINLCLGVAGAVIGDALYYFAGDNEYLLFTLGGALSQITGALLLVLIFSLLHKAAPKNPKPTKGRHDL